MREVVRAAEEPPEIMPGTVSIAEPVAVAPAIAPAPVIELAPGSTVAQYEIIKELGRGGMGQVFMARDTKLGRVVAIKFLIVTNPTTVKRFLVEAQTTARCTHENIVVIHEVATHQGFPFMVLEFLEGQPLSDVIKGRTLSPGRVVELMIPVARALIRAHEFGIVHRDLKPDNVFVAKSGTVKVLDFGVAKLFGDEDHGRAPSLTSSGVNELAALEGSQPGANLYETLSSGGRVVGTLPYMSPEQFGVAPVDERTDLWACGVMMFRLLSGQHPLPHVNQTSLLFAARDLDEPHRSLAEVAPTVPDPLIRLVDRLLRKRKDERTSSATELLGDLEALLPAKVGRRLGDEECPYPGLAAFQEGDADRFFGRSRDVTRAVGLLRDLPLLAVVGPSGAGKSSFVRAGLIPELKSQGVAWETLIIRPGRDPLRGIAELIETVTGEALDPEAATQRLCAEPGWLGQVLRARARQKQARVLVLVDQFEELYTLVPDDDVRAATAAVLHGVADDAASPLRLILSMRSDFLHRVAEQPAFSEAVMRGLVLLGPPGREGLREAIVGPAEKVDYTFEAPAMVETMLDELRGTSAPYPLMQFCLSGLWAERDSRRRLLLASTFTAMGGVAGALATHADQLLLTLGLKAQRIARAIFQRLVTSDGTRAIVDLAELLETSEDRAEAERVLTAFVDGRLLLLHEDTQTVEVIHEALVAQWPTLRRWMEDAREDVVVVEQLRGAARQWEMQGRAAGLLWRGEQAKDASRLLDRLGSSLAAREREFLAGVVALDRRAARRRNVVLLTIIAVLGVMVAASVVGMLAFRREQGKAQAAAVESAKQRDEAQRALAAAEAEKKQRVEAVAGKQASDAKVLESAEALDAKNRELQKSLDEQKVATQAAQTATADAIKARNDAEAATKVAEAATREARIAKGEADAAAKREKERADAEKARADKAEAELSKAGVTRIPKKTETEKRPSSLQ